ncbi:hypothetical protein SAMN06298216_0433 [Spirosomataceae bacterium TFI 002]|nr:hypothetical protein SAMN06298216_0433 [Spirosomataceae bacterium TFI 002]
MIIRISIVLMLIGFTAKSQERQAFYFIGNAGIPSGSYKTYLQQTDDFKANFGLSAGYLVNPRKKTDYSFPILVGGEIGFQGLGSDFVPSDVGGSFSSRHTAYWFNFVSRYLPIKDSERFKPFVEFQFGPKLQSSKIFEQVSSEESYKVDGFTSWSRNYGLGGGMDFKLNPRNRSKSYMEISLFYFYGEKSKRMLRNSALIDGGGFSNYAVGLASSQNWQIRLGIIGLDSGL